MGSVRAIADAAGVVQQSVDYDPYGDPLQAMNGFAFTGEYRHASGLQYHRARYYDPMMGIFPSLDPFEGIHSRPMSLNGYSWVEGNVMNAVDRNGRCSTMNTCEGLTGTALIYCRRYGTPHRTCSGQELDDCDRQYLAHVSAAEATGTNSNAAIAGVMLAQINKYKSNSYNFYGFRVAEKFLEQSNTQALQTLASDMNIPRQCTDLNDPECIIQQPMAYEAYRSLCQSNNLVNVGFARYAEAYEMACQMKCIDNPLERFNYSQFSISGDDITKLGIIARDPNMTDEKGFVTSLLYVMSDWANGGYGNTALIPYWWDIHNPQRRVFDNHIIFEGSPNSVLVHSSPDALHVNWQCEQSPGTDINYAVFQFVVNNDPSGASQCLTCDPGSGVWHDTNPSEQYLKRCNVNGVCRGWRDNGERISGDFDRPCSEL